MLVLGFWVISEETMTYATAPHKYQKKSEGGVAIIQNNT